MATQTGDAHDERQIRRLLDGTVQAIRAKDLDGSLAHYAPDVLSFDVVNPLQFAGSAAVKDRLQAWFSAFAGPIGYELRDLTIAVGDDVAFGHSLNHVSATRTDGGTLDMWWRATLGFRKIGGTWMVTHAHTSVPFDVESGQASLDLKP